MWGIALLIVVCKGSGFVDCWKVKERNETLSKDVRYRGFEKTSNERRAMC